VLLLYLGHTADWQTMAAPFLDGMLSEAKPGFVMVDGYESSYGFRDAAQFAAGRTRITRHAVAQSYYGRQYRQHVQAGFAVWPCNWHGKPPQRRPFDPADFCNNHYTPDELAYTTQCALSYSDKYVWVWSESLNFWKGTVRVHDQEGNMTLQPIPKEYVEALERGKRGNLPQPPLRDYSKADTTPK